ncbi:MAG: hypothetical protein ABSG68_16815 [Thermoguttaceae bacterium]|jgi:hypothetical protein
MRDRQQEQTQRELRLRIARLRRRIDGHIHTARDQGRRLLSWRTYVRRYPFYALLAAAGAGLTLSATLRPGRIVRWLGQLMMSEARRQIVSRLQGELSQFFGDLMARSQGETNTNTNTNTKTPPAAESVAPAPAVATGGNHG